MITYEWIRDDLTAVFCDNKRVGKIRRDSDGFRYYPKTGEPGQSFETLEACKRSLESESDQ